MLSEYFVWYEVWLLKHNNQSIGKKINQGQMLAANAVILYINQNYSIWNLAFWLAAKDHDAASI